ncbi:MAG: metallophosphoesterase family protein [Desulfobacterales bacterium]|nr:MAG: metallophosphoesterase family protein [Desulfobacterales bacterium]
MKIGILSDLHVDLENIDPHQVLNGLVAAIKENSAQMMIVAGDVANDYKITLDFLQELENASGVRCLFVPGNHDIWNEAHPDKTAWDIYHALEKFPGNLAGGPVALTDQWVVIGDLGWYDYSFGSREYTTEEFDRMKIDNRLWQDKIKAIWGKSTLEMHHYFHRKLEKQLEAYKNKNIVLVTHVLPLLEFTVQPPNHMWNYLNAFLGSRQYGELALKYAAAYSICGHVHYRRQIKHENTIFICNCLNYTSQWIDNNDPVVEVKRAFKTIEIN